MSQARALSNLPSDLATLLRERFEPVPALDSGRSEQPPLSPRLWDEALLGPLEEFLDRPGKRFRARLVELGWSLGGGAPGGCPPMVANLVEMLHAGSLIVDDIEDESEVRRGGPALHRVHGVPIALNAGNWLYFWPLFELARLDAEPGVVLAIFRRMSEALLRCHQGQALDIGARPFALRQPEVEPVVRTTSRLKTGSLMELAATTGALAAGADEPRVRAVADVGRELGMALQMLDDLGGITSASRRAKGDEDLRRGRVTWPWAWLAQVAEPLVFLRAQREARRVHDGADPSVLRDELAGRVARDGRRQVRAHLESTFEGARSEFGSADALSTLADEVERLERSY